MSVFKNYSLYYDLLYKDKDYKGEANYIDRLIQKYAPQSKSILELGCGTGNHAVLLADMGYFIHGIDLSEEMLTKARTKALKSPYKTKLEFSYGDVRDFSIDEQFDVVLSLFHVVSYQSSNRDLENMLKTVSKHIKKSGIFIFDFWYGPAVLTHKPSVRVKRMANESIEVTRIAEPTMYPNDNIVDVNYQVFIRDKHSNNVEEIQELHKMRYLFMPEIEGLMSRVNIDIIDTIEWLTDRKPSLDTWGVCVVGRVK